MGRDRDGRSRRPWGSAIGRWIGLLVCVGFAAIFLMIAVGQGDRDRHLLDADRTAEATVLERTGKQARVAFRADGRRVVAEVDVYTGTRSGDRITVRYHPDDPARYATDVRVHFWPFLVSLIALAGAGWLAVLTWRVWRS